ncbi:MAG: nuclear transport factor 2 family protein [Pyrinomonadaceae bacterium]
MSGQDETSAAKRRAWLREIAEAYFEALRTKNFDAIPYHEDATVRAPFAPGGVNRPLAGKEALRAKWWQPLEPALEGMKITVLDHYINEAMTGIVTEAEIEVNIVEPSITLRVADRFTVNEEGQILEQENHFDPRDVTHPGWRST